MNKMSNVRLYKKDENFNINFDETISSRKIMKMSIFLDGIQGICVERTGNIFSVFMNGLDKYAVADIIEMLGEKQTFDREAEETVAKLSSVKEKIKDDDLDFNNFCSFCDEHLRITLRDYQYKSAYLFSLGNGGFDFSVPGAGKTIITYAAYAYLKEKGMVDKILVVGPGNAFNAWFEEYETCFGKEPDFTNLSFETTKSCQIYLNASGKNHTEISFINFDKLRLSKDAISNFLTKNKALLIVDEAHKVKNPNAAVTKSICEITKYANSRIILTGTPMPNGYEDLSSLFYIFSPFKEIIPYKYAQLKGFTKKGHLLLLPSYLIEGTEKISVKKEKQDKRNGDTANTCKLHGKAQLGFSLFTQSDGKAQTKTAKQSRRAHNNGYNPAQNAQKAIIMGIGQHAQKQTQR